MAYLDAAAERIERQHNAEFEAAVASVQIGTVIAHDRRQLSRWRSRARRLNRPASGPALTGQALERAVMGLARRRPGTVALPGQQVRRMMRNPPAGMDRRGGPGKTG